MMDLAPIVPWISAVISIITLGTLLKNMLSSGEKQLAASLDKAVDKLIEHDRRIQAVESELKHMPDRDTTHRLEIALEKMSGRLDTMVETLKPIRETTRRMDELMLDQAKEPHR